jgi:IS30 family transposase
MSLNSEHVRFFISTMLKNDYSAAQIYAQLKKAWEENAPALSTIYRIIKELQSGDRHSLSDLPKSGRPKSTTVPSNTALIEDIVNNDRHMSITGIAS